jgi:hypothetical protein
VDFDNQHKKHLNRYAKEIELAYNELVFSASNLYINNLIADELFRFKNFPAKLKQLREILKTYQNTTLKIIKTGVAYEWDYSDLKNDALKSETLLRIEKKIGKELYSNLKSKPNPRNSEALRAFQNRKIGNFTISERVWNITDGAKVQLENALDVALNKGQSAQSLAREIKRNLNNPDALFRKVRDKNERLKLSKSAKEYKPGQGVYRSAHQNALRLARNEINIAYKESDSLRINQNKDIVGFEVYLSNTHTVIDFCDDLAGNYPKTFKFNVWHVNCKCGVRAILKTDEELINEINNNITTDNSVNRVNDVSSNFKDWVKENEPKMENWKRKPEFITENRKFIK